MKRYIKKIICLILCALMLTATLTSCAGAPDYEEIEGRFRQLVEASAEINVIFFGVGLETYDRVYDPRSSTEVFRTNETGEDGAEVEVIYYYYELVDKELGRVVAFRSSYLEPYKFARVTREKIEGREPVFANETTGYYAYLIEDYVEPEYEFYYMSTDPTDYDYVKFDGKYTSVDQIKAAAEKVYSKDYLSSVYDSMFIGTLSASGVVSGLEARYIEYADDEGGVTLMKSNEYEPFFTEVRQYDFSTAKMVRPSNSKYVNIEVESFLPSKPSDRLTVRISMILQDGVWLLDSATY